MSDLIRDVALIDAWWEDVRALCCQNPGFRILTRKQQDMMIEEGFMSLGEAQLERIAECLGFSESGIMEVGRRA